MINYVKGDLFKLYPRDRQIIIPHIVNNKGLWGSGFVIPLGKNFPKAEFCYRKYCKLLGEDILGYNDFINIPASNVVIVNMVAQNGIIGPNNPKPIKYQALVECLNSVKEHIRSNKSLYKKEYEIHAPKFGSERAGGNWNFIEELIEEIWCDNGINVTIYQLER